MSGRAAAARRPRSDGRPGGGRPWADGSAVELEVVFDLLGAHGVEAPDEGHCLLACPVVHGVHPQERHTCERDASEVPVVPFDAVLIHHVPAPCEPASCKDWWLDV